jgi:hypothetical protein
LLAFGFPLNVMASQTIRLPFLIVAGRLVEGGRYESDSEQQPTPSPKDKARKHRLRGGVLSVRRVPHDHWPHTPRGPRDWRLKLNYSSIMGWIVITVPV